ncbi:hypothetical protein TSAR_003505 [Trichomalopsis sarcophagae]|uniref:Uncharacterized protein n=1 Tax=Trichomalopsis sarcophagae TaxID=543379 RepID=A0A232EDI7_9HYME|nr:hypothetical protein TSAR_003505 [Trichomalopsis sarcophagae]
MDYSPTQDRLTGLPMNVALPLLDGLVALGSTSSAPFPTCFPFTPMSLSLSHSFILFLCFARDSYRLDSHRNACLYACVRASRACIC